MMNYYSFEALVYYKEFEGEKRETGIIAGRSYKEAVKDLLTYYGEEGLEEFSISLLSDTPLMVNKKEIKKIAERVIW